MLELGMAFSSEQIVIANDTISRIKKAWEGIPVSKETLAIGAIKKAGAGNNHPDNKITPETLGIGSTRVF